MERVPRVDLRGGSQAVDVRIVPLAYSKIRGGNMRKLMIGLAVTLLVSVTITFSGCKTNTYFVAQNGNVYPFWQLPADTTISDIPENLNE